jgi:hypothetical protein
MGDRGNIVLLQQGGEHNPLYLYTHWSGVELPQLLQRALRRRERWTDESYLARIIFCTMIEGYERRSTGFGISTYPIDNEYPLLVVSCASQRVTIMEEDDPAPYHIAEDAGWSFEQFCAFEPISWHSLDTDRDTFGQLRSRSQKVIRP